MIKIHLYRPFDAEMLNRILPISLKKIFVMDKWRDPTNCREPLFTDVVAALHGKRDVHAIGGRFGIGSRDLSPPMVDAMVKNLKSINPKDGFTVGVLNPETMLPVAAPSDNLPESTKQCIFWGLCSDGTVGANKDAI